MASGFNITVVEVCRGFYKGCSTFILSWSHALWAAKRFMYDDQTFQPGLNRHEQAASPLSSMTMTEPMLLAETPQPIVKLGTSTLILVPFGLIALWTIALVYFQRHAKRHNELGKGHGRKPHNWVPCRNCIFFKSNPYLKCAVNPIDALTTNAIDCTDYTPHTLRRLKK